ADGVSTTAVTVKLKDAQGNALTSGGSSVGITTTKGTVGLVTDNGNGTYTATLTAPTAVGTAVVSASVGGSALATTASVQFVPGAATAATSTIEAASATLTADGTSTTAVTVKLKDAQGNALTSGGSSVGITTTKGTVGLVTDNGDGTYTATLTAPTTVGTAVVSASVGGGALATTASVQFVPGAASAATSTVETASATLTADGVSTTAVTVKLKDAQGSALTSGGSSVGITTTKGTVGPVTDNGDGTYMATYTASTVVGGAVISASVGGSVLTSTASVQLVPGEVSAAHSTVTAADLVVRADGLSKAVITVKLKDDYDHLIAGKRVLLQAQGGQSVIDDVYGITDAEGSASFSVSNTLAESVTYAVKEEATGQTLNQTVNITFTYDQPPMIGLLADPVIPTFGSVTITVSASAYGQFNHVASVKWAAGSRPISYFDTQGLEVTDHFIVQANGTYSVYVKDTAGNANVSMIEVMNIVPLSSNASLKAWQLIGVGGTVKFDFDPAATSYTVSVSHAVYGLRMTLTSSDVYSAVYVNGLQVASGSVTDEYNLVIGNNTIEVLVKAQDGSLQPYTLNVIRSSAVFESGSGSSDSDSDSASGASSAGSPPSPSNPSLTIWINEIGVAGIASLRTDTDGGKSVDVVLNQDALAKALDSLSGTKEPKLAVSIKEKADTIALRLPGDVVSLLAGKEVTIALNTVHGQYRLPLTEIVHQESNWTNDTELQLTIGHRNGEWIPGLQDAANKGGFRVVADPIHFDVQVKQQGETKEVTGFNRYVERVIHLPADASAASTVIVWDNKLGARPVPTAFTEVDGQRVALIHSLTNSVYVAIAKTSRLTDAQEHWAAKEIGDMNARMIVNGVEDNRFAPEAAITRAELAAMIARALGLPEGESSAGFRDVTESSWYSADVAAVKAYGIMDGLQDGVFGPDRIVSRQEAIVTMVRALRLAEASSGADAAGSQVNLNGYSDHQQIAAWASDAIRTAIQEGLVEGYGGELRPQKSLTRAETAVLLHRMLQQAGFINK
ncbi:invasin domain 3-containing protein, partial [Paenibacillus rigui]